MKKCIDKTRQIWYTLSWKEGWDVVIDNDTTEKIIDVLGIMSTFDWMVGKIKKLYEKLRKHGKHERK